MKSNLIKDNNIVKVKIVGNEVVLHNVNTCNTKATIKRIGNGKHINVRTGEIVTETKQVKRGDSLYSLLESNLRLQDLIKENTINTDHIILSTLTYAKKVLDIRKVNEDFKVFIKYLRRKMVEYGNIEYINTAELHSDKSGYHLHAILFFNEADKSVFIPMQMLLRAWQNGTISVGKPKTKAEVYCYLTPHLSNEVTDKNSHMHHKALMQMELPAGQNLYRYSKGIKKPVIQTDTYENVQKYLKANGYVFDKEQIYLNPMETYKGNNLYYCRETYKKQVARKSTGKRMPI